MTREESNAHLDLFPSEAAIVRREMRRRTVALAHKHVRWAIHWCGAVLALLGRLAVGVASRTAPYIASAAAFVSSRLTHSSLPHLSRRSWTVAALTVAAFGSGLLVGAASRPRRNVEVSRPITTAVAPPTPDVALRSADAELPPATVAPPQIVATSVTSRHLVIDDRKVPAKVTTASRTTKQRVPRFSGSLLVNSRPAGARVFLNGRSAGTTPLMLTNQAAGSRAVRVALDGYTPWSSVVQIVTGAETRLQATLTANPVR